MVCQVPPPIADVQNDTEAVDVMEKIVEQVEVGPFSNELLQLETLVNSYELVQALALLKQLAVKAQIDLSL